MNNFGVRIQSMQLVLVLSTGLLSSLPVRSQPVRIAQNQDIQPGESSKSSIFAVPPPPTDYGEPGRRSSAGSRNCAATKTQTKSLTALVPAYDAQGKSIVGGVTTALNPTFWFFVPFELSPKDSIEFVLKDAADNYVYKTKFLGRGDSSGIVNVSLPSDTQLEANQSYSWHFLTYCNSSSPSNFVSGFIKRVTRPELGQQLATATPREQVKLYAEAGLWYDALTNLAELYRQNPQDQSLRQDWGILMQDVQLEQLAGEPFSTCCGSDR